MGFTISSHLAVGLGLRCLVLCGRDSLLPMTFNLHHSFGFKIVVQ